MNYKLFINCLLTITILLFAMMNVWTQNNGLIVAAPDAATGFSTFSMPQNLGAPVNSADTETAAVVAPNGLSLYFSRIGGSGTFGIHDLWVSQRPTLTSAWGAPQNLGPVINTAANENMPALSLDGKTMFFSSGDPRPAGFGGGDLYMTTRTDPNNDFGWTAPVNLGAVINTPAHEFGNGYFENPTNGTAILYFTSTRTGGLGGEDIYQSTRNADGTFNAPTNVAALNSASNDRNSAVRRDGLEIFFTSQRGGGLGERDIWVSTRASISAPWNPPVNLAVVNSTGADEMPSLSPDGAILYFSSDRNGGIGGRDLYTAVRVSVNRSSTADFDGDGRSDLSVFRPSDGTWYVMQSGSNTFRATRFGANGDKIVPGDYDGDGRMDFAVFRPTESNWYVLQSSDNAVSITKWGLAADKPVPGDYDGDGRTDIAVYRDGTWYIVQSSNGNISYQQFGLSSDIPVATANAQ